MATPKNPKTPDASLAPAAVVTPVKPTLPDAAAALERATAAVAARTREADEAHRAVGLVQSDPRATEEQRQAAWDAFDIARGRLSRAESEVESVRGLHADLERAERGKATAAETARIAAMVASVSEELAHHHDETPAAIRDAFAHLEAARSHFLKERARMAAGNVKHASIAKYLPKDAKGYPVPAPSDGALAGGVLADCLHEAGGTLVGMHPLILASLFDVPPPSRDDPHALTQLQTIVRVISESLTQGKRSVAKEGKEHFGRPMLKRAAEVLSRHRSKVGALEELEALDRADEKMRQAFHAEEHTKRLSDAAKKALHARIRNRGNPVVDLDGKVKPRAPEFEIIGAESPPPEVAPAPERREPGDLDPNPLDEIEVPKVS